MKLLRKLLFIFFPSTCLNCTKLSKLPLCSKCYYNIKKGFKLKQIKTLTFYLSNYSNQMKELLKQIKYQSNKKLSKQLARAIKGCFKAEHSMIVIPIPSSKKRIQSRGFEHTEELFSNLKCQTNINFYPCLERIKETKPLNQLKKRERIQELKNCFSVKKEFNAEFLNNKTILLVDDIITSESTLNEAKQYLSQFNPKQIVSLGLSHQHLKHATNHH